MQAPASTENTETTEYGQYIEAQVVRLYATIVVLLSILGGLVWGAVVAVQIAPSPQDDTLFVLLALGGMALAFTVVVLLAQLAQWARRRY